LCSRPLKALLSHFLGNFFTCLPTIDYVSLLSGQITLCNLHLKPNLLDGLVCGIVEKVRVSVNVSNLSANLDVSGAKLIFTRNAASSTTEQQLPTTILHAASSTTEQQLPTTILHAPSPPPPDELVDILNKSFDLSFTIHDSTISLHNTTISIPIIHVDKSFIATAELATVFYLNQLVANVYHVSYSHPQLTVDECIILSDHIPHQLFTANQQENSTSASSEPSAFSILVNQFSAYITYSPLTRQTQDSFYDFHSQLNLENYTQLPSPFSDESYLNTRRNSTSKNNLVSDLLAHKLNQSHIMAKLEGFEFSSGMISLQRVIIDEWILSSTFTAYTPIVRFAKSKQSSPTSSFAYDFAKDDLQDDVTITLSPEKVGVKISECLAFIDLECIERLSNIVSADMSESVYYAASEDARPSSESKAIQVEISAPFVRVFVKSPDYTSIIASGFAPYFSLH